MKRLLAEPTIRNCVVCGQECTLDYRASPTRTCSRLCGATLRQQIAHPERFYSNELSPYALARAYRRYVRNQQSATAA